MGKAFMKIDEWTVGGGAPCLVIGEVAQAHDGSLGMAHAYIDAIAAAGADAVKFQTHIAASESSADEPWRVKFSYQDESRYAYWQRMEFSPEQWLGLKRHAEEKGLLFLSSPFSEAAVALLANMGIKAWKIASGELSNDILVERIFQTRLPVLISSGMSDLGELDRVVGKCQANAVDYALMQCTTAYPCPPEKIGLNMLPVLKERYACPVGLSDHSGAIFSGLAAVALGCNILEVHVTLSRKMFGPDVASSVTDTELAKLIEGIRFIEKMLQNPVDKSRLDSELGALRRTFFRSVALIRDLPAGTVLKREHLTLKKPGTGIPPQELGNLPGKRLMKNVHAINLLRYEDISDE